MVTKPSDAVEGTLSQTFAERMGRDARLKLRLEDQVTVNKRYSTLFAGLKLNTEHNSAIFEPLLFLLRRTIFAAVIVFMPNAPLVGTMIMLVFSLGVLAFLVSEKPWIDPAVNKMAIINELFFHVFLVVVLGCASIEHLDSQTNSVLGWAIIVFVCVMVHLNIVFMMA